MIVAIVTVRHLGVAMGAHVGGRFVFPRCALCAARWCCLVTVKPYRGRRRTWKACHACAREAVGYSE